MHSCLVHEACGGHARHPVVQVYNPKLPLRQRLRLRANTAKEPATNMYYSLDLPAMHAIFITSYIEGDDFGPRSAQYKWLEADLKRVDRAETPWVVVSMHAPWYTSYTYNFLEAECMRQVGRKARPHAHLESFHGWLERAAWRQHVTAACDYVTTYAYTHVSLPARCFLRCSRDAVHGGSVDEGCGGGGGANEAWLTQG